MKTFEEALALFACANKSEEDPVRERIVRYGELLQEMIASPRTVDLVASAIEAAENGDSVDAIGRFGLMGAQLFAQGVLVGMEMEKP